MSRAPSLFVSHGSPMFALEPGVLGPNLSNIGAALNGLRAIAEVSPHWSTRGVRVTGAPKLGTLHDFGGFPPLLYGLRYPASGEPALATRLVDRLAAAGFAASDADEPRTRIEGGMTHGVLSMDSFGFGLPPHIARGGGMTTAQRNAAATAARAV